MGIGVSKNRSKQDDCNTSLLRTKSAPLHSYSEHANQLWWEARLPRSSTPGIGGQSPKKELGRASTLKPVREDEECGLWWEEESNKMIAHNQQAGNLNRSVSFRTPPKLELKSRFTLSRKSFKEGNSQGEDSIGKRQLTHSMSELASPLRGLDMRIGLSSLLNPVPSPPQSNVAFRRGPSQKTSPSLKGDFQWSHDRPSGSCSTVYDNDGQQCSYGEEAFTPLFDPSLLATFERAVEAMSDDGWGTSDLTMSENISSSSDTCSDADSPKLQANADMYIGTPHSNVVTEMGSARLCSYIRKFSFSRFLPLDRGLKAQEYLDRFERRCPAGCEKKIVLYFTSLRVVRKTFEDCSIVRLIMKGFRVHVDERDVSMHSKFRQELTGVMGAAVSLPRLFIMGRHIGGAAEVELLHEEGILRKLVEGLPMECKRVCDICGDVRFIPCMTCSGSCKVLLEDAVERCPDCNENGLIICPMCAW